MLSSALVRSAPSGAEVGLRSGRGPRVVYAAHSSSCTRCRDYMLGLLAARDAIAEWGGRLTFVLAEQLDAAAALRASFEREVDVLADAERVLGLRGGSLIVADEWGEEHYTYTADATHVLPEADEVVDWVRFTAIQCEECERPEGGWQEV